MRKIIVGISAITLIYFFSTIKISAEEAKYVGTETCKSCHTEYGDQLVKTVHGKVKDFELTIKEAKGCEGCHGPGSLHAEAAGEKSDPKFATLKQIAKLNAVESSKVCLSCHKQGPGMDWKGSSHAMAGNGCNSCHDPHKGKNKKLLKQEDPELCFSCHAKQKAEGKLNSHHPVAEGKMKCTSCHNPHSASNNNLKKERVNDVCNMCHMEKKGPFTFEHPPVAEDCSLCHVAHGTVNRTLLKQTEPFLCMQCHNSLALSHPNISYKGDASETGLKKMKFTRCTNCHAQIHGTNLPSQNGHGFTK